MQMLEILHGCYSLISCSFRQACFSAVTFIECVFFLVWVCFFFHSPNVDLFGKDSSVDTKQHSCMFHKLQDKKQLSFIFQFFSLVSVECNHTHMQNLRSTKICLLSQISFHPISLVHTVICFCIC